MRKVIDTKSYSPKQDLAPFASLTQWQQENRPTPQTLPLPLSQAIRIGF